MLSRPSCSGGSLDLVKTYADIEDFRRATGTSSVMLARAAMWNASVFSDQGPFPVEKVMEEYLKYVSFCWIADDGERAGEHLTSVLPLA